MSLKAQPLMSFQDVGLSGRAPAVKSHDGKGGAKMGWRSRSSKPLAVSQEGCCAVAVHTPVGWGQHQPSGAKGKPRMDAQIWKSTCSLSRIRRVGVLGWKLIKPALKLRCKVVAQFQLVLKARGRLFEQHGLLGTQLRMDVAAAVDGHRERPFVMH